MDVKKLPVPLAVALGAFALVRPLMRVVADRTGAADGPLLPIGLTLLVTGVWVLVVGLSRVPEPVLTLVVAGLTYAVLVIPLSAVLSLTLEGELQGPLARPLAIVPLLVVNAVWGAIAGVFALLVQRVRGTGVPR